MITRWAGFDVRETVCFGAVGITATATYFILAMAGAAVGMPAFSSSLVAYGISALVSYGGHRLLTFRSAVPVAETAPRFVALAIAQYGLALAIPAIATDVAGLAPAIGFGLVCVLVPITSYLLMARCVFGGTRAKPPTVNEEASRG